MPGLVAIGRWIKSASLWRCLNYCCLHQEAVSLPFSCNSIWSASPPSKVGPFSFEYCLLFHGISSGIHHLPCFGRLACCPTPALSFCACSNLCCALLGGWSLPCPHSEALCLSQPLQSVSSSYGRLACCPTLVLSLCASPNLCLVRACPLGSWLFNPPWPSAFIALLLYCFVHWEFSTESLASYPSPFSRAHSSPTFIVSVRLQFAVSAFQFCWSGGSVCPRFLCVTEKFLNTIYLILFSYRPCKFL
jgi:hypothetical protein